MIDVIQHYEYHPTTRIAVYSTKPTLGGASACFCCSPVFAEQLDEILKNWPIATPKLCVIYGKKDSLRLYLCTPLAFSAERRVFHCHQE
eukprot:scaffold53140_cov27-Prasinocladus_malaysianus.AAC.1